MTGVRIGVVAAACLLLVASAGAGLGRTGKGRSGRVPPGPVGGDEHGIPALGHTGFDAPEPASEQEGFQFDGRVIDEHEAPLAEAAVVLTGEQEQTVRTNGSGIFHFRGVAAGLYKLAAHTEVQAGGPIGFEVTERTPFVTIRTRQATVLAVAVLDAETGDPVARARVRLLDLVDTAVLSSPEGEAMLRGLTIGRHTIVVNKEGFAEQTACTQVAPLASRPDRLRVRLARGAPLSGRVVDEHGTAVAGAQVHIERAAGEQASSGVNTEDDGAFSFDAVRAGALRVVAEEARNGFGRTAQIVTNGRSPTRGVELRLNRGASLRGRVIDSSGVAVVGAIVRISDSDGMSFARETTSDRSGGFTINGLALDRPLVAVATRGSAASPVVRVSANSEANLVLDSAGSIEGLVVSASGEPVPDAQVVALQDTNGASSFPLPPASVLAGEDGRFVIRNLREGAYRMRAFLGESVDSSAVWLRHAIRASTGAKNVRLKIEPDGSVQGQVSFRDGSAPGSFSVGVDTSATLDFSGPTFVVSGIPIGQHIVTLASPEFETKYIKAQVPDSATTDLGNILVDRLRTVSGIVVRADGSALQNATVTVAASMIEADDSVAQTTVESTAVSDFDGKFTLTGIRRVPLFAVAKHDSEGRSLPVEVAPLDENPSVRLVVRASGAIEGNVRMGSESLPGALVVATRAETESDRNMVTADEDGHYRFGQLAAGSYAITASRGSAVQRKLGALSASVASGETTWLDIEVPSGNVTVDITLVERATGEPLPGAQSYLLTGDFHARRAGELEKAIVERGAGATYETTSVGGASAHFEDVAPGYYSLCVIGMFFDIRDAKAVRLAQVQAPLLPVSCQAFQVEGTPDQPQSATVVLP
jgi:hypothetical protein